MILVDLDGAWPTFLIGAAIGAVVGGVTSIVSDIVSGEEISLKDAAIGAVSGAIAGSGVGSIIGSGILAGAICSTAIGGIGVTYASCDDCVVSVGISGNIGQGYKSTASTQIAFDKNGNIEQQVTVGYGLSTSMLKSGGITVSVFPGMEDVVGSREYSSVVGFSVGIGLSIGVDVLFAGEGNLTYPVGMAFSIGADGPADVHFNSAYTTGGAIYRNLDTTKA